MKQFTARVKFTFEGSVTVNAEDEEDVYTYLNHFGCVLSSNNLHTTLSIEEIPDWDFPIHPEKEIFNIEEIGDTED